MIVDDMINSRAAIGSNATKRGLKIAFVVSVLFFFLYYEITFVINNFQCNTSKISQIETDNKYFSYVGKEVHWKIELIDHNSGTCNRDVLNLSKTVQQALN